LSYLHEALTHLASTVFDDFDSVAPEVIPLPIEDAITVNLRDARICLAGTFLFGTRAACERLILSAGATLSDRVNTKVDYLVIGTRTSPAWMSQPYGEDIQEAVALRRLGHTIAIISERRLLESLC
jgi:NAD-dependent DNA ligase